MAVHAIPKQTFVPVVVYHPGETLNEKLEEMGMSVKEFAVRTSKPEKTIIAVLNGDSAVTSDMAISFENVTRIPAHFWMNKQCLYDEYKAREKREELIAASEAWAKKFPVPDMARLGWIKACKTARERVAVLFDFFGISTANAWEDYYCRQTLKLAFRISLSNVKEPYAISAWLRKGELQAAQMTVTAPYSSKLLKEALPSFKALMVRAPENFMSGLRRMCAAVGVKLVFTPCLPKAPISGSARWHHDTPCVQLSGRYSRYDTFWFSFFHELGHVLLHGKKEIFLEDLEYADRQDDKEREADRFASDILLPQAAEEQMRLWPDFSERRIRRFAKEVQTHPSVVVGRLQHLGLIPHWQHAGLLKKVTLPDGD